MPILSSNPMWELFGLRAPPHALYGGANLGECVTTVDHVGTDGTTDDWYREWMATADRVAGIAGESGRRGHAVSAREKHTLLRFTTAESSGGHCESLARGLYHQRVFDWLDETLQVA
jgi:hypothetical protein